MMCKNITFKIKTISDIRFLSLYTNIYSIFVSKQIMVLRINDGFYPNNGNETRENRQPTY